MRIWLVNPPLSRRSGGGVRAVERSLFYNSPPLGLAYLASTLEQQGHSVAITDCPVEGYTIDDLLDLAPSMAPDLVGFTSTTTHIAKVWEAASRLRRLLPGVRIVLGGPHFNANLDELLDHPEVDLGIRSEGEITLREAVSALQAGRDPVEIPGVVAVRDGELVMAPARPLLQDLDQLPMPARHLLPIRRYRPMPNDAHRLPKTSMITSRGCPYKCIFCDKSTFGRSYRSHSPQRIVEEMHELTDRYGVRDIAFVDSTFTPTRARVHAILDAMERHPPKVSWTCSVRADVLDEPTMRRMKEAGCWRVRVAIESGNAQILQRIDKGVTKEQYAHTVRTAHRLGLQVKGFFMVGHIGETLQTIEESIAFATSLPLKDITVQISTPLRGTPLYEQCLKHGRVVDHDPSHSTFFEPVFVPEGMTADQLTKALHRFYRRFYMRPSVALRHLRALRDPRSAAEYARALPLVLKLVLPPPDHSG